MVDERDPPIENPAFVAGVNVVDIGDLRIARGLTRRPYSACNHHSLLYDTSERRVWCKDCEQNVESFDAFRLLVENYDRALKGVVRRETAVSEAEQFQARSLAAKALDKAWRKRSSVPCCPHCKNGLFPEDFKNGVNAWVSREYALARLGRKDGA